MTIFNYRFWILMLSGWRSMRILSLDIFWMDIHEAFKGKMSSQKQKRDIVYSFYYYFIFFVNSSLQWKSLFININIIFLH